jgi:DnaJ-class molecular chaperone
MTDPRIIPCEECGGDGGFTYPVSHDPFSGNIREAWDECRACGGTGQMEIEVEPVELEDIA